MNKRSSIPSPNERFTRIVLVDQTDKDLASQIAEFDPQKFYSLDEATEIRIKLNRLRDP